MRRLRLRLFYGAAKALSDSTLTINGSTRAHMWFQLNLSYRPAAIAMPKALRL